MPSPLRVMDPYLEAHGRWPGFHNVLIAGCSKLLNRVLPQTYVAQTDERIALVSFDETATGRQPDIVIGREGDRPARAQTDTPAVLGKLEPTTMRLLKRAVEVRETWIEIYHLPEMELVTAIEILSPSNKGGSGRIDYLAKRDALIDQPVILVEIDLLLSGSRMPVSGTLRPGKYVAIVARADRRPEADIYRWPLRQPLPVLPIPLRTPDPDVSLDLGEAFRLTYDRGGYARVMRYGRPLPESLPISPEDRARAGSLAH
jgi:Protein of unknown function (DUF4058)